MVEASDGVALYAEAHGEGTPVLLSCAFATTHENFRPQVEAFTAAGLRIVLWDYRGHGRSGVPQDPAAYSIERVVDDMGRVLDWAAPGERAVVGGLSFGGLASLHFALAHPQRVLGLLLLDSGPGFKNPKAQSGWEAQVGRTAAFVERSGMRAFVEGKAQAAAIGRQPELPAARAAAEAIAAQDPTGIAHFGRRVSGPAPGVIDRLAEIRIPALVLVGEHDDPYLKAAEVMTAKLPDATHRVLAGAGHIGNIEEADAFNELVIGFVRSLPGVRS